MDKPSLYISIMSGRAGAWAAPARAALRLTEALYVPVVTLRNRWYDAESRVDRVSIPVISVGNMTAGGTGKTPFVIELVRRLEAMGLSPAVVSRGYKSVDGQQGDEEQLIRRHCPAVAFVADPDRAWAAREAQERAGADVIVLDDGFQHRRLHRTLDIVLIDATCPFGFDHVLPRGLLREPVKGLRRADLIVVTRCDQVSRQELAGVEARLQALAPGVARVRCVHRVTGVERLDGSPLPEPWSGRRAVLFAGIGHPSAFETTVRCLGIDVVGSRWWPDHHRYRLADIDTLLRSGRFPPYDVLLTTEKDGVKLASLGGFDPSPLYVVKVSIDFEDDGGTILQSVLDRTLQVSEPHDASVQTHRPIRA